MKLKPQTTKTMKQKYTINILDREETFYICQYCGGEHSTIIYCEERDSDFCESCY